MLKSANCLIKYQYRKEQCTGTSIGTLVYVLCVITSTCMYKYRTVCLYSITINIVL